MIAAEAAGAAARVRCVAPSAATDPVRVLIVPDVSGYPETSLPFDALTPPDHVLERIAAALDDAAA